MFTFCFLAPFGLTPLYFFVLILKYSLTKVLQVISNSDRKHLPMSLTIKSVDIIEVGCIEVIEWL